MGVEVTGYEERQRRKHDIGLKNGIDFLVVELSRKRDDTVPALSPTAISLPNGE